MSNSFEHFATKGIQRNLKASRSLEDAGSYYPITSYENAPQGGSKSVLGVFLGGFLVGCIFFLLISIV